MCICKDIVNSQWGETNTRGPQPKTYRDIFLGVTFTRTILRPWESYEKYHPGGCYDSTRNETLHEFKAYLLNIGADASMRTLLKHIDKTCMNTLYNLYDDLK